MSRTLFILGATGFIGGELVQEAVRAGWAVKALARSEAGAEKLRAFGATPVSGDASQPGAWIGEARDAHALIDLLQPPLPSRLGLRGIRKIAANRLGITRGILSALRTLPERSRPLLFSVSGIDDLAPEADGSVRDGSPLRNEPVGFAHIGIPVRRQIEDAGVPTVFVHLGTVYGPGKAFAGTVFPRLAAGKLRLSGGGANRVPMIHVSDAARAIVHLAGLETARLAGRTFLLVDETGGVKLADFFGYAARLMNVPPPGRVSAGIARLALGRAMFETLARDVTAFPSGLAASGFRFDYPSFREGLPPTLARLAYPKPGAARAVPPARSGNLFFPVLSAGTIAALIAVNALRFPLSVPWMRQLSGGLPILDMRPFYAPGQVYQLFEALGAVGRSAYVRLLWSVDVLLPLLLSLFLSEAVARGAFRRYRRVPFAAGLTDYLENIALTVLLLRYPARHDALAWIASILTSLKHGLYMAGVLLAAGGAARRRRPDVVSAASGA